MFVCVCVCVCVSFTYRMLFCISVPYLNAYRNDVLNLVCVAMTFDVFHSITFIKLCCMTD